MKKTLILLVVILAGMIVFINKNSVFQNNSGKTKQIKEIDFHHYPVEEDVYAVKKIAPSNTKQSLKITPKNKNYQQKPTQIIGDKIPDWVYDNTLSSDTYYNIINSQSNAVFFVNSNCSKGKQIRAMIKPAIAKAQASGKFYDKSDLRDSQPSTQCSKLHKESLCIMDMDFRDGLCKCAVNYLLDNCMDNFCLINPKARRIVIVPFQEKALEAKLRELKNNWD